MPVVCTADTRGRPSRPQGTVALRNVAQNTNRIFVQLLDRCLQIADPELFQHLRSKNLSAEIYAFPCESCYSWASFCLFLNSLRVFISVSGTNIICMNSCLDTLRVHSAPSRGPSSLGFPPRIWRTFKYSLRDRTVILDEGFHSC